jgi:hypothetical protein
MNFVSRPSTKIDKATADMIRAIAFIRAFKRTSPDTAADREQIWVVQTAAGSDGKSLEKILLPIASDGREDYVRRALTFFLADRTLEKFRLPIEERVDEAAMFNRRYIGELIGLNPDVIDMAALDWSGILEAVVDGIMCCWVFETMRARNMDKDIFVGKSIPERVCEEIEEMYAMMHKEKPVEGSKEWETYFIQLGGKNLGKDMCDRAKMLQIAREKGVEVTELIKESLSIALYWKLIPELPANLYE